MPIVQSALDVFQIAMGMEAIGKDFYEALAVGCSDPKVRFFCLEAAREEQDHWGAFRELYDRWAGSSAPARMTPESARTAAALAKAQIQPNPAVVRKVALGGSLTDAVRMAIQLERDAVSFYQRIVTALPQSARIIQGIVDEEKQHLIRVLSLAAILPRTAPAVSADRGLPDDSRRGHGPR